MILRSALFAFVLMMVSACGAGDDATTSLLGNDQPTATTAAPTPTTSVADNDHVETEAVDDGHETEAVDDGHDETDEADAHEDEMSNATADEAAANEARVVQISMTEMAFTPSDITVSAGETVRFVVTNDGATTHEFRLSNPHRIEEHMATHDDGGHGDEAGHHEDFDVVLELEPGVTDEVIITFPEDTDLFSEVACLLPGHYEAGMHGDIVYDA